MNFVQHLINFFCRKLKRKQIPFPELDKEELLVRGILHPLFCSSKNKLKREALLPPPDRNDVSLLRHTYTDDHFCKVHAKTIAIPNNIYKGLAVFKACHVTDASVVSNKGVKVAVLGTPMNKDFEYIYSKPVYVGDVGLPMHADMLFSKPIIKGEPNTEHREIANQLLKVVRYFPDPNVESLIWEGDKLLWAQTISETA